MRLPVKTPQWHSPLTPKFQIYATQIYDVKCIALCIHCAHHSHTSKVLSPLNDQMTLNVESSLCVSEASKAARRYDSRAKFTLGL